MPFTCGERCENNCQILLSAGIVTVRRLQRLTFLLSFVITLQTFLISFEIINFNIIFSNIISIVVVFNICTFSKDAFLSGLICFLRTTFFCLTNFKLISLNVFAYLVFKVIFPDDKVTVLYHGPILQFFTTGENSHNKSLKLIFVSDFL